MNSKFDYTIIEAINNAIRTVKAQPLILGATASGFGGPPGGYVGYLRQNRVSYDPFELASSGFIGSGYSLTDNLNHIRYRLSQLEVGSGITFLELDDTPNSYTGQAGKSVVVNLTEDGLTFATISGGGAGQIDVYMSGILVLNNATELDFYGATVTTSGSRAIITFSGGGSIGPLSPDKVVITDPSGVVTTDVNYNYYRDAKVIVIGAPTASFQGTPGTHNWVSDGDSAQEFTEVYSDELTDSYFDATIRGGGTQAFPTHVLSGMVFRRIRSRGYYDDSNGLSTTKGEIRLYSTEEWTASGNGTRLDVLGTANGETELQVINGVLSRLLKTNLTLNDGESLVLAGYMDMGDFDVTLNGDSDLEIL